MTPAKREAIARLKLGPQPYNLFNWQTRVSLMDAGIAEIAVRPDRGGLVVRLTPEWSTNMSEPRTLEEMHARALAARRRVDQAAFARVRSIIPAVLPKPVEPQPVVTPQTRAQRLHEQAFRLIDEHSGDAPWSGSDLLLVVAVTGGISLEEIKSDRRALRISQPRQVFFWIARQFTSLSFPQIGRVVGGKDHTTVLYAVRRVDMIVEWLGEPEQDTPDAWARHLLSARWPHATGVRKTIRAQQMGAAA